MYNEQKRIILTGGGSGGHIFPLIAVGKELQDTYPDINLLYIGTGAQMGKYAQEVMGAAGIPVKNILTGKMRRYFSWQYFSDFIKIPLGIVQALWHLLVYMPDAVFSKGGYAAVPVVIAAWIYRIPVLSHDSDAVPGWANRVGGKLSHYVAISYPQSRDYFLASKTLLTGNPIRKELTQGSFEGAQKRWGVSESRPVVLVFGGSQGSRTINKATVEVLPELTKIAQVLHITGVGEYARVVSDAARAGFSEDSRMYNAVPFLDREAMADAYACAHVVIARAGANSITELAANQLVSLLVPLASHDQPMNAYALAKAGGATVLEESNLGPHILLDKLNELIRSRTLREQLQKNIQGFYHPDAAAKIVAGIDRMMKARA